MKIQSVNNHNQRFGMAIKATPEAEKFIKENVRGVWAKRLIALREYAANDIVDVNIETIKIPLSLRPTKVMYTKLIINAGNDDKYHYRPLANSSCFIFNAIHAAVNKAHKLSEVQKS